MNYRPHKSFRIKLIPQYLAWPASINVAPKSNEYIILTLAFTSKRIHTRWCAPNFLGSSCVCEAQFFSRIVTIELPSQKNSTSFTSDCSPFWKSTVPSLTFQKWDLYLNQCDCHQIQHKLNKPCDGQKPPKVILKKGFCAGSQTKASRMCVRKMYRHFRKPSLKVES